MTTNNYFKVGARDHVFIDDTSLTSIAIGYKRALDKRAWTHVLVNGKPDKALETVSVWKPIQESGAWDAAPVIIGEYSRDP